MGRTAKQWVKKVEPHFGYLIDRGFDQIESDSSFWSTWVQYASAQAAVRISRSTEFGQTEVELIRLVEGSVPPYPIWITSERIDWALLDNVIEVRAPEMRSERLSMRGLSSGDLEKQLAFWAAALLTVAPDFLSGSCSSIDEAATLVRSLTIDTPQEVVVWLPEGAAGAEAEARSNVAATLPPEVGLSIRHYGRKKR